MTSPKRRPTRRILAPEVKCTDCGRKGKHSRLEFCHVWALKYEYRRCSVCDRIFLPSAKDETKARCVACKQGDFRARTGSQSIRATSGGSPGLGKR